MLMRQSSACTGGCSSRVSPPVLHCAVLRCQPLHTRIRSPVVVFAALAGGDPTPTPPKAAASPSIASKMFKSLQDFGIGKNALTEGGVGLFLAVGIGFSATLIAWASGTLLRKGKPYTITIQLPLACGVAVGTPVRIRGVAVGSVLNVKPSLQRVDVLAEVNDIANVVPLNSVIEANQSGLIAEPLIDITPMVPIPEYTALPNDPGCAAEGKIVCAGGTIEGRQGVALDDLVYIMTRIARNMDDDGFDKIVAAAGAATEAVQEAKPLLAEASKLVKELTPLLKQLREGGLAGNVEALSLTLADAAADIQRLQSAVLTDENVRALRGSVTTLCRTLEHVESISSEVGGLARDSGMQRNLRTLITAFSRLVDE